MIGKLAALLGYFCVATLLAAGAGAGYLRTTGKLTDDRLGKIVTLLRGDDLPVEVREVKVEEKPAEEPLSLEQRSQIQDVRMRNLELKELNLRSLLDEVAKNRNAISIEKDRYEKLVARFREELKSLREGALSTGRENVRLIWENIKPKQAKEQILRMLVNSDPGDVSPDDAKQEKEDVVAILTAMPIGKRSKIIAEFKTPEESAKLDEILRMIRKVDDEMKVIAEAEGEAASSK